MLGTSASLLWRSGKYFIEDWEDQRCGFDALAKFQMQAASNHFVRSGQFCSVRPSLRRTRFALPSAIPHYIRMRARILRSCLNQYMTHHPLSWNWLAGFVGCCSRRRASGP